MNEADLVALIVFGGMFAIAVGGLIASSRAAERLDGNRHGHRAAVAARPAAPPVQPPTR